MGFLRHGWLLLPLFAAQPAQATAGLFCTAKGNAKAPALALVIGHGYPGTVVGATVIEGKRELTTMGPKPELLLIQAWIDDRQLLLDISDPDAMERVLLFTARTLPGGEPPRIQAPQAPPALRGKRMSEIINLRQVRKAKKRAEDAKVAAANRAAFGRGKAEKSSQKAEAERQARSLDGARLERDDQGGETI